MRFEWDDQKSASNLRKHGVDFVTASFVFDDLSFVMEPDHIEDGEMRWRTVGKVEDDLLLLVVHLFHDDEEEGEEVVRIISARETAPYERRQYERSL